MTRLALATCVLTLAGFAAPSDAQVRVRGGVRVSGSVSVGNHYRHPTRRYATPPSYYYPRAYYPRAYYPRYYYPTYYQPAPVYVGAYYAPSPCYGYAECAPVAQVAAPAPSLPVFSLGGFLGGAAAGSEEDGQRELSGGEVGVSGRLRVVPHFLLEAEISKVDYEEGLRIDRRFGVAGLLDLNPYGTLSPQLGLGIGGIAVEANGQQEENGRAYGELILDLEWHLSRNVSLLADFRVGQSSSTQEEAERTRPVARAAVLSPMPQEDEVYSKARLGVLVNF